MAVERTSDKHSPVLDDEMKEEIEGQLRAGRSTRAEPWRDPEPVEGENQPDEEELIERRREEERGRTRASDARAAGDARG
jgi:hypothetical protein